MLMRLRGGSCGTLALSSVFAQHWDAMGMLAQLCVWVWWAATEHDFEVCIDF